MNPVCAAFKDFCSQSLLDLAGFHESGMKNLTSILKKQGKWPAKGNMIGPVTF